MFTQIKRDEIRPTTFAQMTTADITDTVIP
jgi:hypothetical protein